MNAVIIDNLRYMRAMFGKTQKDFSSVMGLSPQAYSNIENGKRKVSAEELWRIATHLNVDIAIFFNEKLTESVIKELQAI